MSVRVVLVPALRPGDLVVMDNLSPHKKRPDADPDHSRRGGPSALSAGNLPPDLNPIEKMWSKIKNLLRGAEARTPADLITAIGQALAKVTFQRCHGLVYLLQLQLLLKRSRDKYGIEWTVEFSAAK